MKVLVAVGVGVAGLALSTLASLLALASLHRGELMSAMFTAWAIGHGVLGILPALAVEIPLLVTTDRLHDMLARNMRVLAVAGIVVEAIAVTLVVVGGIALGVHPAYLVLVPIAFVVAAVAGALLASRWAAGVRRRYIPVPAEVDRVWLKRRQAITVIVGAVVLVVLEAAVVALVLVTPDLESSTIISFAFFPVMAAGAVVAVMLLSISATLRPVAAAAAPESAADRRAAWRAIRRGDLRGLDRALRDDAIRWSRVSALTTPMYYALLPVVIVSQLGNIGGLLLRMPDAWWVIALGAFWVLFIGFAVVWGPIEFRRVQRVAALPLASEYEDAPAS